MPLRRALSIVLRSYKVGEADKIVVFLTQEYGKLRGMARAARRPRSRFGASLEMGTEVELTFFEKENRELVSVDRCDIVRSRFSKLGEPILATTLGYVTELIDSFAPEREPNERLYRLLRATIGALAERPSPGDARPVFRSVASATRRMVSQENELSVLRPRARRRGRALSRVRAAYRMRALPQHRGILVPGVGPLR